MELRGGVVRGHVMVITGRDENLLYIPQEPYPEKSPLSHLTGTIWGGINKITFHTCRLLDRRAHDRDLLRGISSLKTHSLLKHNICF